MSVVLLASSLIYKLTGFERKESFEKAAGLEDCCDDEDGEKST